ncbi:hypothetical protein HK097_009503, partial [Rhizophlyctis rosea]
MIDLITIYAGFGKVTRDNCLMEMGGEFGNAEIGIAKRVGEEVDVVKIEVGFGKVTPNTHQPLIEKGEGQVDATCNAVDLAALQSSWLEWRQKVEGIEDELEQKKKDLTARLEDMTQNR